MLTPEKIEELRGLLAKATPGPWKNHLVDDTTIVASNGFEIGTTWPGGSVYNGFVDPAEQHEINAALIVAMRNALPALLDLASRVERAEQLAYTGAISLASIDEGATRPETWKERAENRQAVFLLAKRRAEAAETHSAALARALEDVSAKVDAFWNDPERPSVHRMRSKSVHELSDAQRRARSLLAPKEDTDA